MENTLGTGPTGLSPEAPPPSEPYEVHQANEQKQAILELLSSAQPYTNLSELSRTIGVSRQMADRLLFELCSAGEVRIDRTPGSLAKRYSLPTSKENRLIDAFVGSLGEGIVADTRFIRQKRLQLDAMVQTVSKTYVVKTIIPDGLFQEKDVGARRHDLLFATREPSLRGATPVLLIGISDESNGDPIDLRRLEADGILVKYVTVQDDTQSLQTPASSDPTS